jgi:hypothetical protein
MGKVILDAAMLAKLNGLTEPLELYDEQGNLRGHFQPADEDLSGVALPGPDALSDEEIAEAMKDTDPGRPLADILADLRRRYP